VLQADHETLIRTLADVRGLQRTLPGLATWTVRDGTMSGWARIATAATLGTFDCAVTVVRSVSVGRPGIVRMSGTQIGGPIRWHATMDVAVVDAGPGATRMDVAADIRVSGAGPAIGSGDVEKALQAAVSSLDVVRPADSGGREGPAQEQGRISTNTDPVAFERGNLGRPSCAVTRVDASRRTLMLLCLAVVVGILFGRALPRRAARVVPRR
jgi:carbon monoxide dehydrogenase subunit G